MANVKVVPAGEGKPLNVLGHTLTFKAVGEDTDGAFEVVEGLTPPQLGLPLHVHSREDETFYVLEGEFEFQVGESVVRATPGTFLCGPRGVPHSFKNIGANPGKLLVTISPATLQGMMKELSLLATEGPPDMGKVVATCQRYGIEFM